MEHTIFKPRKVNKRVVLLKKKFDNSTTLSKEEKFKTLSFNRLLPVNWFFIINKYYKNYLIIESDRYYS